MLHVRLARLAALTAATVIAAILAGASAASAQTLAPVSQGVYRIPYATGTKVRVAQDAVTHAWPGNRYDLTGEDGDEPYRIVAAADGMVRFIEDGFDENRPDLTPCDNNYVWIEHPTGEWTKYTHMTKDSVPTDLQEGKPVKAGTFLGYEDDVGCAHGKHLHFQVTVPTSSTPKPSSSSGGIIGPNRLPWICGLNTHTLVKGAEHVAQPCKAIMPDPGSVFFFGYVPPGWSRARNIDISNSSGADRHVTFPAATTGPFRWSAFDKVIPNGERARITVTYRPSTTLLVHGVLNISSGAPGSPHRVPLTGGCASIACLPGF
jgi:hypothetical protein